MNLTTEMVQRFVGGQAEIQNPIEGYLYRGEIKDISIIHCYRLRITFAWMAKGIDFPPVPKGWVLDEMMTYEIGLDAYDVCNIGPSQDGGDDRICLNSFLGETTILFPPNGSKIARPNIIGVREPQRIAITL
ncbi:MAG: hypothetical protein WCW14_00320 [Candidatus Paceibacterota bacterium]|jgi:hypothetical protein